MTIKYGVAKSAERLAIEEALKTGTREAPIDSPEISRITGIPVSVVRSHVANCLSRNLAHNVNAHGAVGAAYAWGLRPDFKSPHVAQPRDGIPTGRYMGEKPAPIREGAMEAYGLPTLSNGERIERKRPFIIGARAEQRV
jgi:hypothetical protein